MAWTTPGTAIAGDVLTASFWNTNVRDNSIMNSVYTNEAARDAAITSPVEGMQCYLTAPTVPAATGTNTIVPTGIQTIYNGSVWVCVTPIGADTAAQGTTTSANYTASLSGSPGTNPSVTLVTGTSAFVSISNQCSNNAAVFSYMGVAVSGAGTVAASELYSISNTSNNTTLSYGKSFIVPGLTAGTNTFTLQYKVASSLTFTVSNRTLAVSGIA